MKETKPYSTTSTFTIKQCAICGVSNGTFASPFKEKTAYINHVYGYSPGYLEGKTSHKGIDYAGIPRGASVYPSAPGMVIKADFTYTREGFIGNEDGGGYGNHVYVDHGKGITTRYAHLDPETAPVTVGQFVDNNTRLGKMGNTGFSTGPHLHFETRVDGNHVNPEGFLGTQTTNLTPEEFAVLCPEGGSGGADLETYPDISKDEAANLIANYLKNNIGHYTTIENLNPTTQTREEIQIKDILTKYPNTPETEVFKQYLYLENSCNIYHQNLQRTENRNNQEIAYDAVLVVNPYNKQVYMVKNAIFEKYVASDKWCGVVGVPRGEEWKAGIPNNSRAVKDSAWGQYFVRGANINNSIYAYSDNKDNKNFKAYFTVNTVANEYEGKGGTWSDYKFPKGDTWPGNERPSYCKQWFEGEGKFGEMNNCEKVAREKEGVERPIIVSGIQTTDGCPTTTCSFNLTILHGSKEKYNGGIVWFVTHGRQDNPDSWATKIGDEINKKYPNDTVILTDWRDIANDGSQPPLKAASWASSVATGIKQRLDSEYGVIPADNLNVIGHSLGTVLSTEISEKYGKAKLGILLAPPGPGEENAGHNGIAYYDTGDEILKSYQGKFQFSRSFVTLGTAADHPIMAQTADEAVVILSERDPMLANTVDEIKRKHSASVNAFLTIISSDQTSVDNGWLGLDDRSSHNLVRKQLWPNYLTSNYPKTFDIKIDMSYNTPRSLLYFNQQQNKYLMSGIRTRNYQTNDLMAATFNPSGLGQTTPVEIDMSLANQYAIFEPFIEYSDNGNVTSTLNVYVKNFNQSAIQLNEKTYSKSNKQSNHTFGIRQGSSNNQTIIQVKHPTSGSYGEVGIVEGIEYSILDFAFKRFQAGSSNNYFIN